MIGILVVQVAASILAPTLTTEVIFAGDRRAAARPAASVASWVKTVSETKRALRRVETDRSPQRLLRLCGLLHGCEVAVDGRVAADASSATCRATNVVVADPRATDCVAWEPT